VVGEDADLGADGQVGERSLVAGSVGDDAVLLIGVEDEARGVEGLKVDLLLPLPPRPPHHPTGLGSRMLAVLEHLDAVDEDVAHAGCVLVGLVEGGVVGDLGGIEDGEVGEEALG
jgi:hypothetical protein